MTKSSRARSFETTSRATITLPDGRAAHRDHIEHSQRLEKKFYNVRPGVWSFIGNGLSNQSFIEGPEGIIAIDTGESNEEMAHALVHLREHTDKPIVAVLYTHFHYITGTQAIVQENDGKQVPIWGHERIKHNREGATAEIGPTYTRGLVEQFAILMPETGTDGNVNVGLGRFWRDPMHAPFTSGFIPPTNTFGDEPSSHKIAGLRVDVIPSPSDANDSVTYWFPELDTAVNNTVWPVLFNVFAIRGEEYRDPRILVKGVEKILALNPEHLVGVHGPPISGREEIQDRVTKYRDSIQFLWDQAVRSMNKGLFSADIGQAVELPAWCDDDYLTSEFYGVAEHHMRQIRTGLFGFFDGNEANLFPLTTPERSERLIEGFGGRENVEQQLRNAIEKEDIRWALELGSWLVHSPGATPEDKKLLATALRTIAQRTTSANIRSWCITRALILDGSIDFSRFSDHRFSYKMIIEAPHEMYVAMLRVTLDPDLVENENFHIGWDFGGSKTVGLHIRNSVAFVSDGKNVDATLQMGIESWAEILTGKVEFAQAVESGKITIVGDKSKVIKTLNAFEIGALRNA
jgi:alkyl sulfatase BDS1-like metallo-beta-lactamase superfamily hydrolase